MTIRLTGTARVEAAAALIGQKAPAPDHGLSQTVTVTFRVRPATSHNFNVALCESPGLRMNDNFTIVFDLRGSELQFWPYLGPVAIPIFVGIVGLLLCRDPGFRNGLQGMMRPRAIPVQAVFGAFVFFGTIVFGGLATSALAKYWVLVQAIEAGQCRTVEGVVERWEAVGTGTKRKIKFQVSGTGFAYRHAELQPGYSDAYGINPRDRVRIQYCDIDPTQIVRLEKMRTSIEPGPSHNSM